MNRPRGRLRSLALSPAVSLGLVMTGGTAVCAASPTIVEVHYDDTDPTARTEFIELHNPATNTIDLGGWQFTDAVTYAFPQGTTVEAGGYRVVAEDPSALLARFGVTALGPWSGKLDNDGERIALRADPNVD